LPIAEHSTPKPDSAAQLQQVAQAAAVVGTTFALVFLCLMIANGYRQYAVGVQKEAQLTALKQKLLREPDNTTLVNDIRHRDLALRANKLRQLDFTSMGALMLLISAATAVSAYNWLGYLKGIAPLPSAEGDPPSYRRRLGTSRIALAILASALTASAYYMTQQIPSDWLSQSETVAGAEKPGFATPEELVQNWHRFRGFAGSGVIAHKDTPTKWDGSTGAGIRWQTPVPLPGYNSPVVWQNRIFLTGATEKERAVYGIDAETGRILWTGDVPTAPGNRPPDVMEDTGFAASTAATDGARVYAIFASGDLAAFDFSGIRRWHISLGIPDSVYGYASSLEIWQDKVLVQYDQAFEEDSKSRLYAVDGGTGRIVWEVTRPVANSWTTPIVGSVGNTFQLITVAAPWVIAYHPDDGKEIWRAEHMSGDVASSPILAGDLVIAVEPNAQNVAIRPGGTGNITETHLAWRNEDAGPDISSPVTDGDRVYLIDTFGTLYVVSADNGALLYEHEFETNVKASPSLVDGKLYILAENGTMFIGTATDTGFTLETTSALGERCLASPAFMAGRIYMRGTRHLFCIGDG